MAGKTAGFVTHLRPGDWFYVGDAKVIAEKVKDGEVVFRVVAPKEMKIVHRGSVASVEPKETQLPQQ